MVENFILLHYSTKSRNRQLVNSATLFATRVKYMEKLILQEQFKGFIIFNYYSIYMYSISNIEDRIFLDTHTASGQQLVTKFCFIN